MIKKVYLYFKNFSLGAIRKKIDVISSDRGKTHLIYRYQGDPGYDTWFDNDYLILKLYYDSKKDEEVVGKSLEYIVEYAKERGNILNLDIIDINNENAAVLEGIQYSGKVIALAERVRVTQSYGISNDYVKTNKINITNNAEDINNLMYYFDSSKSN